MSASCPSHISYGQFSASLHATALKERIPLHAAFELTFRCNLECIHCYCPRHHSKKELTLQQIYRILDEIADAGCLWLLLTGGEPLLRNDFKEIYTYAKRKGMIITLFTNGTLIDQALIQYFSEYRPFVIEITVHALDKEGFEKISGTEGSFDRCMRAIDMLLEKNIPLRLKTMAMTVNRNEILKVERFAKSCGVPWRFDAAINSRLDGSKTPCSYRLLPEEVVSLDRNSKERTHEWMKFIEKYKQEVFSDKLYLCSAGIDSFTIDPFGRLTLCEMVRQPCFDLIRGAFKSYWYNDIKRIIEQKHSKHYRCKGCELISLCGSCPGWSLIEHGDYETPVEYLCRIAQLRAEAFGLSEKVTV